MQKCSKPNCGAQIPESTPGLSMCLPCHITELNRFMTSPKTVIEINIGMLKDCSTETLFNYWTALTELNTRVKLFHDSIVKQDIAQGNRKKASEQMAEVERIRRQTSPAEKQEKIQLKKELESDAKFIKFYVSIRPTVTAEEILRSMRTSTAFNEWTEARILAVLPAAKQLYAKEQEKKSRR